MIQDILTFSLHPAIRTYFILTTGLSVYLLLRMPSRLMSATENFVGSVICGICFGWIAWPFIVWAFRLQQRWAK